MGGGDVVAEVGGDAVVAGAGVAAVLLDVPGVPRGLAEGAALAVFEFGEEVVARLVHALLLPGVVAGPGRAGLLSLGEPRGGGGVDQPRQRVPVLRDGVASVVRDAGEDGVLSRSRDFLGGGVGV